MTSLDWSAAFGALRALAHGAQDSNGWLELCTSVERAWRHDAARVEEQWLPYLAGELERWPDALRTCPPQWSEALVRGKKFAPLGLVRAVDWRGGLSAEVSRLAYSDHAPALRALTLRYVPLTREAVDAIASGPISRHLHTLAISHSAIGKDGALRLAAALGLRALRALDLTATDLSPSALDTLATAPWLAGLHTLRLGEDPLGDHALSALVEAGIAPHTLAAPGCGLTGRALDALVQHPGCAALRVLELGHNALGDAGAIALARGAHATNLTALSLEHNAISDHGARAIADAPALATLRYLNLDGNPLTQRGRQDLLASRYLDPEIASRAAGVRG